MQSLLNHETILDPVPGTVVQLLATIDRTAGEATASRPILAERLQTLVDIALIQSTEASNAIESIHIDPERLKALINHKTMPMTDRDEAQIAGYRDALNLIHSSADAMPFSENVVKQLHQSLYRYTSVNFGGKYKLGDNTVTETHPDGTEYVRFRPVLPADTPLAMGELQRWFDRHSADQAHHPLLLACAYVFDFLMIHPFQDGNGRTARLVTLLLSYQAGYDVGRYISLERLINDTRDTYYQSLEASTIGWHDGSHSIWPWMRYILGIIRAAYRELDDHIGLLSRPGHKRIAIREFIRSRATAEFTINDLRENTGASDAHIRNVIRELKQAGAVETVVRGRSARYRRLHVDF